jgi:demethylmenaquinone methyltransferase/2-methoxy-6-polyprenyl-1,4-benzoquinol methylase
MAFRESFDCLWCGRAWTTRSGSDLEGWAGLCPDCLGRAQENPFLRFRLRTALAERAAGGSNDGAGSAGAGTAVAVAERPGDVPVDEDAQMQAYYAARAPEYDQWYLREGRYSRGPVLDMPWHHELDQVGQWLDALPIQGEIVELAAGTGWWSTLLAQKGELWMYDVVPEPLDVARGRLVSHGLRAHLHLRDAWEEPDRQVDALFAGFWLSHVRRERLPAFLGIARRWLKPHGLFAFVDSRPDPDSGARDHPPVGADEVAVRRLADGHEYRIPKVFYAADELEAGLRRAGFIDVEVRSTERFFLMGRATAGVTAS